MGALALAGLAIIVGIRGLIFHAPVIRAPAIHNPITRDRTTRDLVILNLTILDLIMLGQIIHGLSTLGMVIHAQMIIVRKGIRALTSETNVRAGSVMV